MTVPLPILTAFAFATLALAAGTPAQAQDAKAKFVENKCNACHTVSALKIDLVKSDEPDEEEAGADDKKPADLSKAGAKRDQAWIEQFLLRKERIDGKRHKKKFTGPPDDIKVLAGWLSGLK